MRRSSTYRNAGLYRLRIQICIAATLILLIGIVRLWPPPRSGDERTTGYHVSEQEIIDIEEIQPTRQARRAPPPPAPPIPIVVPDDVVLDHVELEFSDANLLDIDDPGDEIEDEEGEAVPTTGGVTVGPKAVRFVEPEYTREARRRRVRAEVVVEVLVDDRGRVQDTSIEERFLLNDDDGSKTPVAEVGYGLEEAAVSAARRWIFRPARENGKPVASYTTLTFTFGV